MTVKLPSEELSESMGLTIGPVADTPTPQATDVYGEVAEERYGDPEAPARRRSRFETAVEMASAISGSGLARRAAAGLANRGIQFAARRGAPLIAGAMGAGLGEATARQATLDEGESRARETALSFARGALGETLGAAANRWAVEPLGKAVVSGARRVPGLRHVVDPLGGKLDVGGREAIETLRPYGVQPSPGQVSTSGWVDTLENIVDASLTGRGRMEAFRRRGEGVAERLVRRHVEAYKRGASMEDAGKFLQEALENGAEAHRATVKSAYRSLDRAMPEGQGRVDLGGVLNLAKTRRQSAERLGKAGSTLRSIYDDILLTKPDKAALEIFPTEHLAGVGRGKVVSFEEAAEMRSVLLERARMADDPIPGRTTAAAKEMAGLIDEQMSQAAKSVSPEVYQLWRDANELHQIGKTGYNNRVIRDMISDAEPEKVYRTIVSGASTPSRIRKIRGFVEEGVARGDTDPLTWEAVQGQWLDEVVRAATDPKTGRLSGDTMLTHVKRLGPERMAELFPNGGDKSFERLARTLYITQKRASPDAPFAVAMKLSQAGAVLSLPATLSSERTRNPAVIGTTAIVLGPVALARVLTNPTTARLLTIGMTSGPTRATSRMMGQFVSHLDNILPEGSAYVAREPGSVEAQPAQPTQPTVPHISELRATR